MGADMLTGDDLRIAEATLDALGIVESAKTAMLATTHAPKGNGGTNWITKSKPGNAGQLPAYIQNVRNAIMRGKDAPDESRATAIAIGKVRDWAEGKGGVGPEVKAASAKAIAEFDKMRARSKVRETAEESPLTMSIDVGDLTVLEATATKPPLSNAKRRPGESLTDWGTRLKSGDRANERAAEAKKDAKKTRSGASSDFEKDHPRGRGGSWTLKTGAKGEDVRAIQRRIGARSDGDFGERTTDAVKRYQREHGLQVDGVVGAQTMASLRGDKDAAQVAPGKAKARDKKWLARTAAKQKIQETPGVLAESFDTGDLSLLEARGGLVGHQRRDRVGKYADVPGVGDDAPKLAKYKVDKGTVTHEGTDPAGQKVRVRKESSGSIVVEKDHERHGWIPNRFNGDATGERTAHGHFLAQVEGGDRGAAREQGPRMGLGPARSDPAAPSSASEVMSLKPGSSVGASQRVSQLREVRDEVLLSLEGKGQPLEQRQVENEMLRRGLIPKTYARKTTQESAATGALTLRVGEDLRLIEATDTGEIHEAFDLALVETVDAGSTLLDLALVEAAAPGDALFNADGTVDFVIIRPCNGRGTGMRIYEAAVLERDAGVFAGWPSFDNHESPEATRARRGIPRPPSHLAGQVVESWWDPTFTTPNDAKMGFDQGAVIGRFNLTEDMERLVRRLPRAVKTSVNAQATGMRVGSRGGKRGMIVEGFLDDPENSSVDLVTKAGAGGEVAALYREMAIA